jgi:LEA14-like dessication related protein
VNAARYSPDRAELAFALAVFNPNAFTIPLEGLTYDLKIAGHSLSSGTLGTRESVGAGSRAVFDVNVTLAPDTSPEARGLIARGQVPYEVTGELLVGSFQRAFSLEGEVKLSPQR